MYAEILKAEGKPKKQDAAHYKDENGKRSNAKLHEDIESNVEGRESLKLAREAASASLDKATLDILYPTI